jgi:hypothetical protein
LEPTGKLTAADIAGKQFTIRLLSGVKVAEEALIGAPFTRPDMYLSQWDELDAAGKLLTADPQEQRFRPIIGIERDTALIRR